jgi:type IV pilus assembly protein PilW
MVRQRGFSIVELMIGLTIGLLMLSVLSALLVNNSQARVELDRTMQQVENGRYAMQLMFSELRLAGYYGDGESAGAVPAAVPDPCATDMALLKTALPVAVQGYSQVAVSPLNCLSNANVQAGSDILVVRRALSEPTAAGSLNAALPYIQTIGDGMVFDVGANSGSFTLTDISGGAATIHRYMVQIYFISPCSKPVNLCSASSDGGNPIPTLNRLELDPNAAGGWSMVSLVEGIERMRVEYGLDSDGDGAPDSYVLTTATAADWNKVVSVNVGLLARNSRATQGYLDKKTYRLVTLDVAAANDQFKRHAYNGVVKLKNVSDRRIDRDGS